MKAQLVARMLGCSALVKTPGGHVRKMEREDFPREQLGGEVAGGERFKWKQFPRLPEIDDFNWWRE